MAEEIFAYSWDRAVMAYRVSASGSEDYSAACRLIIFSRLMVYDLMSDTCTTALPEQGAQDAL